MCLFIQWISNLTNYLQSLNQWQSEDECNVVLFFVSGKTIARENKGHLCPCNEHGLCKSTKVEREGVGQLQIDANKY